MKTLLIWALIIAAAVAVGWWYGITIVQVQIAITAGLALFGILAVFALAISGAKELIP